MSEPIVGIVTRTKNRRVLLKRALESVLAQSYPHWVMVIVNDGGDRDDVEALLERYADAARGRIRVIHNPRSLGMEGASKVGLDTLDTDLFTIHDDDDRWAPEFLAVSVRELQRMQRAYPSVQAVTTLVNVVHEKIQGNLVHIESVESFNTWIPPGLISLDRMLVENFLPPIAFVFNRRVLEELGGLYEPVPYLGDWDFLIRFLLKYDIYIVPQHLAFYHWRSELQAGVLGNSVTGEVDRHHFIKQLLLNRWLRQDLAAGRFGIGAYANLRGRLETMALQGKEIAGLIKALPAPVDLSDVRSERRKTVVKTPDSNGTAAVVRANDNGRAPQPEEPRLRSVAAKAYARLAGALRLRLNNGSSAR